MRIVRYWDSAAQRALIGVVQGDKVVALSGLFSKGEASFENLLALATSQGMSALEVVKRADLSQAVRLPYASLDVPPDRKHPHLLQPVVAEEIWAAGVTYERSRHARKEESVVGDIYERVYDADRPELFFKATPSRCVGPNEPVGLRGDSRWLVPEPEIALVIGRKLEILGYTLGNDMSARDIEGANPLYLPQAKVFCAGCSVGPAIVLREPGDTTPFPIICSVQRGGEEVFQGETSTASMHRTFSDLVGYLGRCNTLPAITILLTGTGIVPPDEFSLQAGDIIEISSPQIGTLRNPARMLA
jgi:2-dehydro-3-deoxy-D-arabinonate dehydratase